MRFASPEMPRDAQPALKSKERFNLTAEEKIDRLTGIVDPLASTVVAHDNQIDGLIKVEEKQGTRLQSLTAALKDMSKQWQAYLNRLPPR
jgi:hypothetical protein